MTIERAWKDSKSGLGLWKEIDEETANREMAHAHGDNAADLLSPAKEMETRFAHYRIKEEEDTE